MLFEMREEEKAGVVIIKLAGRLDAQSAPDFDARLAGLIKEGKKRFVIDMAGLDMISSAGWSIFIECAVSCKKSGGEIKLAAMNEIAAKIYNIMGISSVMDSYATAVEATQSFRK